MITNFKRIIIKGKNYVVVPEEFLSRHIIQVDEENIYNKTIKQRAETIKRKRTKCRWFYCLSNLLQWFEYVAFFLCHIFSVSIIYGLIKLNYGIRNKRY